MSSQVWDISTSPPSLLTTFSFASPISHVVWDPLERFFFAAGPSATTEDASRVMKVSLYRKKKDEYGYEATEAIGGGGRGDVERVKEESVYAISWVLSSLSSRPALTQLRFAEKLSLLFTFPRTRRFSSSALRPLRSISSPSPRFCPLVSFHHHSPQLQQVPSPSSQPCFVHQSSGLEPPPPLDCLLGQS